MLLRHPLHPAWTPQGSIPVMGPEIIAEAAQAVEKGGGEVVSTTPNYALLPSYVSVARDLEKRQRQDDIFSVDYSFSI